MKAAALLLAWIGFLAAGVMTIDAQAGLPRASAAAMRSEVKLQVNGLRVFAHNQQPQAGCRRRGHSPGCES